MTRNEAECYALTAALFAAGFVAQRVERSKRTARKKHKRNMAQSKRKAQAYKIATDQLQSGVSVNSMEHVLRLKEEEEDFLACAGIKQAIEDHVKHMKKNGSRV